MAMENCELRYEQEYKTFATKNLTRAALEAVFGLNSLNISGVWLKDSSDTYIFPDEQGMFPTLEEFGIYDVEVCLAGRKRQQDQSSEENSSDDDLFRSYKSASTSGKKAKKGGSTQKKKKGKGARAVPGASGISTESWYFKITIGEINQKKITPLKNCLIKCNVLTTCTTVKEEIAKEMAESPYNITLYDSDFLKVEDSPGRVGRYWSGTRKVFAVITKQTPGTSNSTAASTIQDSQTRDLINEGIQPLTKQMVQMQQLLMKGCNNVLKDIATFAQEMFKCPICIGTTKDEVPHATSCCNHVFCVDCANQLSQTQNSLCPLCKQKRGPLYPILLSGVKELIEKIGSLPSNIEEQES